MRPKSGRLVERQPAVVPQPESDAPRSDLQPLDRNVKSRRSRPVTPAHALTQQEIVREWIGVPVYSSNGQVLGTVPDIALDEDQPFRSLLVKTRRSPAPQWSSRFPAGVSSACNLGPLQKFNARSSAWALTSHRRTCCRRRQREGKSARPQNWGLRCVITLGAAVAAALLLCVSAAAQLKAFASNDLSLGAQTVEGASDATFEQFLDHLMRAESNGRDTAANPRSTAVGAFQFIESTFRLVAREHFALEVAELSDERLLALRTNRNFARRAAAAYCKENAAYLRRQGLSPTFGHLRLAYLLGAGGAAKVLKVGSQTRLADILGVSVLRANPFMKGMTAADLIERSAAGHWTARRGR